MKYLLMIYGNQETWAGVSQQEWAAAIAAQETFNREFFETGELLGAYGLADAENAKVVRVRSGATDVTDGPYLEAKEYLASYYLLDCESGERALEIVARMPFAAWRAVEVWPVMHAADGRIASHHRLAAVRAHLLEMAGEPSAARSAYLAAARQTTSTPEKRYLERKASQLQ